jgi:hypothetical protein
VTSSAHGHIEHVVRSVEHLVRDRPVVGAFDDETVLAFDVLMHALTFTHATNALDSWRAALWQRQVSDSARAAMVTMLEYIMAAAARGEMAAVLDICDCLRDVVNPDVFTGRRPAHAGDSAAAG